MTRRVNEREYTRERLTQDELKLVDTMLHSVPEELRIKRANIMKREVSRDIFWGFYDRGIWPGFKRAVYKILVHPILKKSSNPTRAKRLI